MLQSVCVSPQSDSAGTVAQDLDVRWPTARLSLQPEHAQTYPEVPVMASLEFSRTTCTAAAGTVIPELWLELLYCGHSPTGCANNNTQVLLTVAVLFKGNFSSPSSGVMILVCLWLCLQVVFSQQVLGYPMRRDLTLKCELFGLAGHYVLTLRSKLPTSVPVMQNEPAYIKVNRLQTDRKWRGVSDRCLYCRH